MIAKIPKNQTNSNLTNHVSEEITELNSCEKVELLNKSSK